VLEPLYLYLDLSFFPDYLYLDLHCLVFQFSTRNNMHDPDIRCGLFLYLICFKGLKLSV